MTDDATRLTETPRDRYGRYLIFPPDPKATRPVACTRATTIASTIDDHTNLTNWKIRRAVAGITLRQDLYQYVASHRDDETALKGHEQEWVDAGDLKKAATAGTNLHRWCELADTGQLDPADHNAPRAHLDAYQQALTCAGITILPDLVERIAYLPNVHGTALNVAGRFDRGVRLHDGRLLIADLKTGGYINGLEWAIQLAIYANCQSLYTPQAWGGDHEPNPGFDRTEAIIIHLPQDAATPVCTIYTVDIAAGWDALKTALDVRDWRKTGRKLVTVPTWAFEPTLPDPEGHDKILARIERIKAHDRALANMLAIWPADILPPKQMTHPYTGTHVAVLDRLLADIEAAHEVPF